MRTCAFSFLLVFFACHASVKAQDSVGSINTLPQIPAKVFRGLNSRTEKMHKTIVNKSARYLKRLQKEEDRLRRKLSAKDSVAAFAIFGSIKYKYSALSTQLESQREPMKMLHEYYSSHLDSVSTSLRFLHQEGGVQNNLISKEKLRFTIQKYKRLHYGIDVTDNIQDKLLMRQDYLASRLQPLGKVRELQKFKKLVYYHRAQMNEYKRLINEPSALERRILQQVSKLPAFKSFFARHSDLASLFRMPEESHPTASLQGLQTRAATQEMLYEQIGSSNAEIQQVVQGNIDQAHNELKRLKDKFNSYGDSRQEIDLPNFKPNSQKSKRFLDRMELGTNLQTNKTTAYFPASAEIGMSIGYKLSDRSVIGIGGSYKMGLGRNWKQISITHEGLGFRTFIDMKLKGSFWMTAGGEFNYRSRFKEFSIIKNYDQWQKSALLGLNKKYNIGKKFKGNAQLLYDFLHRQQMPVSQPLIFRLGYNFK